MAKPPTHRPAPRSGRAPLAPQHALRNPWLEGTPAAHGRGPGPGSHSSGSTTYDGYMPVIDQYAPEPPQPWHQHLNSVPTTPVYEVPEGGGPEPLDGCSLPHRNVLNTRPLTPGGISQLSVNVGGTVTDCGECDALDTWCYCCVQGVLGIAALAGLSLLIASAVLKGQPPRAAASANLSAMPYIGAMLSLVSGALLLVQLFARNEKKRKKKRIRQLCHQRPTISGAAGSLRRSGGDTTDVIPLQDLHKIPPSSTTQPVLQNLPLHSGHPPHQFQPLLPRSMVGQHQQIRYQDTLSPAGTPWWRRQPSHPGRVVYPS